MRTMTLIISASKLTASELRNAVSKVLTYLKEKSRAETVTGDTIPHGKQTVKELISQDVGVSNVEISDKRVHSFDRVARKYGVDYAVKKVKSEQGTKFYVFFKSRDADAITAALTEYTSKVMRKATRKSVLTRLHDKGNQVQDMTKDRVRERQRERER